MAETERPVEVILFSNCGDKELDIYSYPDSHTNGSQQLYYSFKDGQMNVNAVPWLASEILKPQYQDVVSDLWSEMLSALGILGFLPRDMNKSSPIHPDIDSGLPGNVAPNRRIETSKSGSTVAKIGPQSMALTSKASLSIQRTCTCGQSFLDDFVELRPGAAREYETQLRHFANITHANGLSRSSHLSIIGPWLSYLSPWKTQRRSLLPHNVAPDQRGSTLQTLAATTLSSVAQSPEAMFLLLCYPQRKYATSLLQLDLTGLTSDQTFFSLLRNSYRETRGPWRQLLSLKTLQDIKFAQFDVWKSDLVDI